MLRYEGTATISTQTELSVLYLECDILTSHTHSVLTKGNNLMIEVPLNVAKCLFFRNVLYEKIIGEEKAFLMYLFWKVYIPQHSEGTSLLALRSVVLNLLVL